MECLPAHMPVLESGDRIGGDELGYLNLHKPLSAFWSVQHFFKP